MQCTHLAHQSPARFTHSHASALCTHLHGCTYWQAHVAPFMHSHTGARACTHTPDLHMIAVIRDNSSNLISFNIKSFKGKSADLIYLERVAANKLIITCRNFMLVLTKMAGTLFSRISSHYACVWPRTIVQSGWLTTSTCSPIVNTTVKTAVSVNASC